MTMFSDVEDEAKLLASPADDKSDVADSKW